MFGLQLVRRIVPSGYFATKIGTFLKASIYPVSGCLKADFRSEDGIIQQEVLRRFFVEVLVKENKSHEAEIKLKELVITPIKS